MFRFIVFGMSLIFLVACGGGGGGGEAGSRLFITNEQLLPGIVRVNQPTAASGIVRTRLYINDLPNTQHESWVREVVTRLHPSDDILITDYRRDDIEATFDIYRNYIEQAADTVTVLPRGFADEPYQVIYDTARIATSNGVNYNNLGLLVLSAGNESVSFTNEHDAKYSDRTTFLNYLSQKRTIIAVGTNALGTRHSDSNYCESWYIEYCVGASYHFFSSDGYKLSGTSFSAPVIGVAAAIMKEQFSLDNDETFDITTRCAELNPAGPGLLGGVNLECMFTPQGDLFVDQTSLEAAISGSTGGTLLTSAASALPSTPGWTSVTVDAVYDEWGRDFGVVEMKRPASFTGSTLPPIDWAKAHQVMSLNGVNLFIVEHGHRPLIGIAFDNGVSIDAAVSDEFFGINHAAYEGTQSLRMGYQRDFHHSDMMFWGGRMHYTRQHASGGSLFKNISGHGVDGEVFTSIALPMGEMEISLTHDIFLGGTYEFLSRDGRMKSASSSAVSLGYVLDF